MTEQKVNSKVVTLSFFAALGGVVSVCALFFLFFFFFLLTTLFADISYDLAKGNSKLLLFF